MHKAPGGSNGRTGTKILVEAMSKDKVHLARFVLDALDGKIVDSETEEAQTPLISSVLLPGGEARYKFTALLLQRGATVNGRDVNGRTALSHACESGYLDAVQLLVRNNADPEIVDVWGNTALMYAAVADHSPVVEFLVRAFKRLGLQLDRHNKVGNSALEVAKFLGHTECLRALTNSAKRGRENGEGALGDAQQSRISSECSAEEKFDRKVAELAKRIEILHACPPGSRPTNDKMAEGGTRLRPAVRRNVSLISTARLQQSMDSIEEFEPEHDGHLSPPQKAAFSGALAPKPPPRPGENSTASDSRLPPLSRCSESLKSLFFSPRPGRTPPGSRASSACAPGPLGLLLTPIVTNGTENVAEGGKRHATDFGARGFRDSYYRKRCSLPTSVLGPAPPERGAAPLRKSRTTGRRTASSGGAENPDAPAPAVGSTLSALGGKLLRRFTFPELKKCGNGPDGSARRAQGDGDSVLASAARIPRSETYPQVSGHPQVGSKPSIDSISAVKCEFDFRFGTPPS